MEVDVLQWGMLNSLQIALPLILVLFLLRRFYETFQAYQHLLQIPHPNALQTIFYLISMARKGAINVEAIELLYALSRLFSIFLIWLGHIPVVFICTPQQAEIVLTREESLDRAPEMRFLSPSAVGNTVFVLSPVREWRKRRRMLNPAFHIGIIERYLSIFNKHAAIFVDQVRLGDPTQPIDLLPNMQRCTMDIICETAMGIDIETQKGSNIEFLDTFSKILKICLQRAAQPWWHPDIVFNCLPVGRGFQKNMDILNGMSRKIIAEKKARMLSDPATKKQIEESFVEGAKQMQVAFIDLLLYQHLYGHERLPEEDILAEVNSFIFGGFDTCSVTLSWALYLIGNDPRVQQVIHDELDAVLGKGRDRPISAANIKDMKYLNCVFKETLRLYPPGGILARYTQKELELNGYTLPAGTTCIIFLQALHRDPRYFPQPERFIPERFLNKNEEWHRFAYIPFAAGPKNCIGQKFAHFEAMTVLASILSNFSLTSASTMDKVRIAMDPITTPFDPLLVYLKPL